MSKKFMVTYRKKGFLWSSLVGDEITVADDIAEAKEIADEHAKQTGWFVGDVSEVKYLSFSTKLEKLKQN